MPAKRKANVKHRRPNIVAMRLPPEMEHWLRAQAVAEDRPITRVIMRALVAERAKIEQQRTAA